MSTRTASTASSPLRPRPGPRPPTSVMTPGRLALLWLLALFAAVAAVVAIAVFAPLLARDNRRYHHQRHDIDDLRDATYFILDPADGSLLPMSRALVFASGPFSTTDGGPGGGNYTVDGTSRGLTFGFITRVGPAGFVTIVTKTAAFFSPEASWHDITDAMNEVNGTGQGVEFNTVLDAAVVQSAGRYLVSLTWVARRGSSSGQRILLAGIGLDGADPTLFTATTMVGESGAIIIGAVSPWFTATGARVFDLAAGTELRVYVMQVNQGAGTALYNIDFATVTCTITAF